MMQTTPCITIDFKKNRIRIFKDTVAMMGTPDYLQLLVNPDNNQIALKCCDANSFCSLKIKKTPNLNHDEYEIYSKALIQRFPIFSRKLLPNYSYNIPGKYIETENLCVFDMNRAEKLENE